MSRIRDYRGKLKKELTEMKTLVTETSKYAKGKGYAVRRMEVESGISSMTSETDGIEPSTKLRRKDKSALTSGA
jgi:hypothetical protein